MLEFRDVSSFSITVVINNKEKIINKFSPLKKLCKLTVYKAGKLQVRPSDVDFPDGL